MRIWLHALSVGEVSSAQRLVAMLRQQFPKAIIILSTATRSGEKFARQNLGDLVDNITPMPLDLLPAVRRYISRLRPDIFILVETDIWPNFINELRRRHIPAILVNGRFSADSFRLYRRASFIFRPLFNTFSLICMQTAEEVQKLIDFGINPHQVKALGNLKYECGLPAPDAASGAQKKRQETLHNLGISPANNIWLVGSTHKGEEEIILAAYGRIKEKYPDLYLIIAPRNIERGPEIKAMALSLGFTPALRSEDIKPEADMLILDSLGELAGLYKHAKIALIGGSLVPERGHNPLEAAAVGCPILFGPNMEDFAEIAADLLTFGAAFETRDSNTIYMRLAEILNNDKLEKQMAAAGLDLVEKQQGVTHRHLAEIAAILGKGRT